MRSSLFTFLLASLACTLPFVAGDIAQGQESGKATDRKIAEWIDSLRRYHTDEGQKAYKALIEAGEPAIPALLEAMNDRFNKDLRELSGSILSKMGPPGVRALIGALKHESWKVRDNAALYLGLAKAGEAVDGLIETLQDEHPEVRYTAALALGMIRDLKAVEPLLKAVEDPHPKVCSAAAEALGSLGDPRAVVPIIRLLKSPYGPVRHSAAIALSELKNKDAVPALIKALQSRDSQVVSSCAMALGEIGDKRAVEPLIQVVRNRKGTYEHHAAVIALGMIGDPRAAPVLKELLGEKDERVKAYALKALANCGGETDLPAFIEALASPDPEQRLAAVRALARTGNPEVLPHVYQLLNDETDRVRAAAIKVLGGFGKAGMPFLIRSLREKPRARWPVAHELGKHGSAAVKPLVALLGDPDESVRYYAVMALGMIGKPAVESLLEALESETAYKRKSAVEILGRIGDERAVDALLKRLEDPDREVRIRARYALREIGSGVFDAALPLLNRDDPELRVAGVVILAVCKRPEAVTALTRVLAEDGEEEVRCRAAEALGEIGDPGAIEPLLEALGDEKRRVASNAAEALAQIGSEAISRLEERIENESGQRRFYAVLSLARMRVPQAIEPLIEAMGHDDADFRRDASRALSLWGEPVLEPLREALRHRNVFVRCNAACALGGIRVDGVVDALVEALSDEEDCVRCAAAQALEDIPAEKAVGPLVRFLEMDTPPGGRFWAGVALASHGDARGLDDIVAGLGDFARAHEEMVAHFGNEIGPKGVEYHVANSLRRIGKDAAGPLLSTLRKDDEKLLRLVETCLGYLRETVHPHLSRALEDVDAGF
ncbi:MAG: HEAT repeat domain-containing protein, partial [Planctomycetota bacterium]